MTLFDARQPDGLASAWEDASDIALTTATRAGDEGALAVLMARHAPAVQEFADTVSPRSYDDSWSEVASILSGRQPLTAPVRMLWLSAITGQDLAAERVTGDAGWDAIWTSYRSMADAWQTALWHHEVEGQSAAEISVVLGIGEVDTRRALVSARSLLRRLTARRLEAGPDSTCQELLGFMRHEGPARLTGELQRTLREHGRHCDGCLGFVRAMFTLDTALREVLATRVLGVRASDYLRTRAAARPERIMAMGGASAAAARLAKPTALAGVSVLAAAAVVGALTIHGPQSITEALTGERQREVPPAAEPGSLLRTVEFSRTPAAQIPASIAKPSADTVTDTTSGATDTTGGTDNGGTGSIDTGSTGSGGGTGSTGGGDTGGGSTGGGSTGGGDTGGGDTGGGSTGGGDTGGGDTGGGSTGGGDTGGGSTGGGSTGGSTGPITVDTGNGGVSVGVNVPGVGSTGVSVGPGGIGVSVGGIGIGIGSGSGGSSGSSSSGSSGSSSTGSGPVSGLVGSLLGG